MSRYAKDSSMISIFLFGSIDQPSSLMTGGVAWGHGPNSHGNVTPDKCSARQHITGGGWYFNCKNNLWQVARENTCQNILLFLDVAHHL